MIHSSDEAAIRVSEIVFVTRSRPKAFRVFRVRAEVSGPAVLLLAKQSFEDVRSQAGAWERGNVSQRLRGGGGIVERTKRDFSSDHFGSEYVLLARSLIGQVVHHFEH